MHTTRTAKGQMTRPSVIRTQLCLEGGDQFSVTVLDAETIVFKRRISRPIRALRGLLPKPAKVSTGQEMDGGVAACLKRKQVGK